MTTPSQPSARAASSPLPLTTPPAASTGLPVSASSTATAAAKGRVPLASSGLVSQRGSARKKKTKKKQAREIY